MTIMKRKRDSIKVIEVDGKGLADSLGLRCQNCSQRHYFVQRPTEANALFCTHCGHITPTRKAKHGRGLVAPVVQQQTAIIQNDSHKVTRRKPRGITDQKNNALEQSLVAKGYTVIDSQTLAQ
jgi:hypothetical protein